MRRRHSARKLETRDHRALPEALPLAPSPHHNVVVVTSAPHGKRVGRDQAIAGCS